MAANNKGIAHAKNPYGVLCKNRNAYVAVSIDRFRSEPMQCKRCADKVAKLDSRVSA